MRPYVVGFLTHWESAKPNGEREREGERERKSTGAHAKSKTLLNTRPTRGMTLVLYVERTGEYENPQRTVLKNKNFLVVFFVLFYYSKNHQSP